MNYAVAQKKVAELAEAGKAARRAEAAARRAKAREERLREAVARLFAGEVGESEAKRPKRAKHFTPAVKKKHAATTAAHMAKHKHVTPVAPSNGTTHVGESSGTRLNDVLKVIHALGGKGSVSDITKRIPNDAHRDAAAHGKLVRGCLSYLRNKGRVVSVKRGQWALTAAGQAAIGVISEAAVGQSAMFRPQEGHA